ncbi:hypothetical protein [Streptomyces beihaiensis]|uniref:Secreted protein n=1 Tax=Streptomyces beihaiensis TaxID=2984495 RepID=A0ABT3TRC6_9ACTN|nr:hypothetical protein [Streptomyces beihaiensis]MCX3059571.1 hypothetical protein [Streptomyces beihaiensis]
MTAVLAYIALVIAATGLPLAVWAHMPSRRATTDPTSTPAAPSSPSTARQRPKRRTPPEHDGLARATARADHHTGVSQ